MTWKCYQCQHTNNDESKSCTMCKTTLQSASSSASHSSLISSSQPRHIGITSLPIKNKTNIMEKTNNVVAKSTTSKIRLNNNQSSSNFVDLVDDSKTYRKLNVKAKNLEEERTLRNENPNNFVDLFALEPSEGKKGDNDKSSNNDKTAHKSKKPTIPKSAVIVDLTEDDEEDTSNNNSIGQNGSKAALRALSTRLAQSFASSTSDEAWSHLSLRDIHLANRKRGQQQRQQLEAFAARRQSASDNLDPAQFDVLVEHRWGIKNFLQRSGLEIKNIEENSHSQVGTPLYNRFVQAWQRVQDQTVVMAFHGTLAQNVDVICREGLDPKRRSGQAYGPGEYFAKDARISVGFCRGGNKMLVFALLTDATGLTANRHGVVVIHKPAHQLPLFVITFENRSTTSAGIPILATNPLPSPPVPMAPPIHNDATRPKKRPKTVIDLDLL